jgi:hypothetical protein
MTTKRNSETKARTRTTEPQLLLVSDIQTSEQHWHLDDQTREIGRQGLAKARAALEAARPSHLDLAA